MNIKGFLYDLDDTLISRDNAFLGFTKKFYDSFIDTSDFSYDEFLKIIRNADKKTKWSTEKKLLFDELRKSMKLLNIQKFFKDDFSSLINRDDFQNSFCFLTNHLPWDNIRMVFHTRD